MKKLTYSLKSQGFTLLCDRHKNETLCITNTYFICKLDTQLHFLSKTDFLQLNSHLQVHVSSTAQITPLYN